MHEKSKLVIEAMSDFVIRVVNDKNAKPYELELATTIACKLIKGYPVNLLP